MSLLAVTKLVRVIGKVFYSILDHLGKMNKISYLCFSKIFLKGHQLKKPDRICIQN